MLLLFLLIDKLLLFDVKGIDYCLLAAVLFVKFIDLVGLSSDFNIEVFWCLLFWTPIIQNTVFTLLQLRHILVELIISLLLISDFSTGTSSLLKQEHYN